MCECEQEEYRTTELELRVSQLEDEADLMRKAVTAFIRNPGSPHAAAFAAGHALGLEPDEG